jgi:hypothetical protein
MRQGYRARRGRVWTPARNDVLSVRAKADGQQPPVVETRRIGNYWETLTGCPYQESFAQTSNVDMELLMRVTESVLRVEAAASASPMVRLELAGHTQGEPLGDGTHSIDGIETEVKGTSVRVADPAANGDPDAADASLSAWFDSQLRAHSISTGLSTSVSWTGRTVYHEDGTATPASQLHMPFRFGGFSPAAFGTHASLAAAIRSSADVNDAAGHLRAAFAVVDFDGPATLGHAFRAVERLVFAATRGDKEKHWREFESMLEGRVASVPNGLVLYLYASCQYGRHVDQTHAQEILAGKRPLNAIECCQSAREVLGAFVAGIAANRVGDPSGAE